MGSDNRYIDIPGNKTLELPPLLVNSVPKIAGVFEAAKDLVDSEGLAPEMPQEKREQSKYDLAAILTSQYQKLLVDWHWGDSILEWIRQCEITFEAEAVLRKLISPSVWPHAGRSSFVRLLGDKAVGTSITLENAVGMRLTFRQPPPIDCVSDQFLFYLHSTVTGTAYLTWASMNSDSRAVFPPNRFYFQVLDLSE